MAKTCCICGKAFGIFSEKVTLRDGYLCNKCLKAGGVSSLPSSENLYTKQVVEVFGSRMDAVHNFRATQSFNRIKIDINSQSFMIDGDFYFFDNLVSYTYHEDPDNSRLAVHNGTTSGAAIGGVIGGLGGGLVGGAIGATIGGKIGAIFSTTCNYMYISVTLKDSLKLNDRLYFINEKTRVSSSEYTEALQRAKDCLDGLQIIAEYNASKQQAIQDERTQQFKREVYIQEKHLSASELADELMIYKTLLYNGDITQEEFDQKKKRLLDMM